MSFAAIELLVANPSPFWRDDYVEVALARFKELDNVPDDRIRLCRKIDGRLEPVPVQIDHLFGPGRGRRVMTFFAERVPPGPDNYTEPTATFLLDAGPASRPESPLEVQYFYAPGDYSTTRDPNRTVKGVKLLNPDDEPIGLDVYFSLEARPTPKAPLNYAGAVTSILHHRARNGFGHGPVLSPCLFSPSEGDEAYKARWGQVTRLDFYPLPWEPRWYESIDLLKGNERDYEFVAANAGPHRAVFTVRTPPFTLRYEGAPFFGTESLKLDCRLYRVIHLYPRREYYSEQLIVVPERDPNVSLAFRAHFAAHVDITVPEPIVARFESIPDYFAVWRESVKLGNPHELNLGYAFASDSHIRALNVEVSDLTWRLQLGHEHRCVHYFLYEPHEDYDRFHTVGHDAWYLRLFKPLEVLPFSRYLRR